MAVDKLVDSTQLNADLTAIADAIRTKGGTSASLAFPADFVSAIQAISGGGGGSSDLKLLASGKYTLTAVTNTLVIPVTYSGTPKLVIVSAGTRDADTGQGMAVIRFPDNFHLWSTTGFCGTISYNGSNTRVFGAISASGLANYSVSATQISFPRVSSTYTWHAVDYYWYIYGEETT